MRRESQYIDDYLDHVDRSGLIAPATWLAYKLTSKQRRWLGKYESSLIRSLRQRMKDGTVEEVEMSNGRRAYRRK